MNCNSKKCVAGMKQIAFICRMQKIVIYETTSRYYIVGSNNTETAFRILKIDRSENESLNIIDDKIEYSPRQIKELLRMVDAGNRNAISGVGLKRAASSFGIIGFVRFLEGYYMILITKRRTVSMIGPHNIYKIDDTLMLYIPQDSVKAKNNTMEQKYLKIFQSTDLSSNFYYSYSYELTQTLQYNMASLGDGCMENMAKSVVSPKISAHKTHHSRTNSFIDSIDVEDSPDIRTEFFNCDIADDDSNLDSNLTEVQGSSGASDRDAKVDQLIGYRMPPCYKYSWNRSLLSEIREELHYDWILNITHGFIKQSNISVYGKPVYLTLMARRSSYYAGARFLKRGADSMGYCANDVETEQIVIDASRMCLNSACVTSFVQLRGSVPCKWSQLSSKKVIPKPMITIDQGDPYFTLAGQHFNRLLIRHGSPIVVLSLVKTKEKKYREQKLGDQMKSSIDYLNQFLPQKCHIKHHAFDMSRYAKRRNINILERLKTIGEYYIKSTGFFSSLNNVSGPSQVTHQQGIIRTNCVDSLDRTNTAQFAIGMAALCKQLRSLGIIRDLKLEFDTDCARMLEHLYDSHGDILALQYAGSHLVHRVRTYKKVSQWVSSSRDMMHTISRYYSNTFSDADKQESMNVFLCVYKPYIYSPLLQIWNLSTDFYLHNKSAIKEIRGKRLSLTQWFDRDLLQILPVSRDIVRKGTHCSHIECCHISDDRVNLRYDYYKPYIMTSIKSLYELLMLNSIRDFMPSASTSYSPFVVRNPIQRRISNIGSSSSSLTSGASGAGAMASGVAGAVTWHNSRRVEVKQCSDVEAISSDDTDSLSSAKVIDTEDEFNSTNSESMQFVSFINSNRIQKKFTFQEHFSSTKDVYGITIQPLNSSLEMYARSAYIEGHSKPSSDPLFKSQSIQFETKSKFNGDSSKMVNLNKISHSSLEVYENYLSRALGDFKISSRVTKIYNIYVKRKNNL